MSYWKEYKLGELVAVNEKSIGRDFNYDMIEYIDTSSVTENKFEVPFTTPLADAPSRAKRLINNGDTIISTVRPIQKHYGFIKKAKANQVVSTGFAVVTPKSIEPRFLYYFLTQKEITEYLNTIAEGGTTTFPAFKADELKELPISLPELSTQTAIAEILSSLDDKIELNNKINQELENLAEALFNLICGVDETQENDGWSTIKLKDVLSIKNGYAFKGMDFIEKGIPVIKIKNVKAGKINFNNLSYVSENIANKAEKFKIKKYDLLITMSGNRIDGSMDTWVGKVGMFSKNGEYLLNQRVSILNSVNIKLKYYLLQLLSSEEYQYHFISNATSSGGQANISPDLISNTEILLPPTDKLEIFDSVASDIYSIIFNSMSENETLIELREILLPKLISGELELTETPN